MHTKDGLAVYIIKFAKKWCIKWSIPWLSENQQQDLGAQIQNKLRFPSFTGESDKMAENMTEVKSLQDQFNDISDSIVRCNASLQGKLVEKNPLMGKTEK